MAGRDLFATSQEEQRPNGGRDLFVQSPTPVTEAAQPQPQQGTSFIQALTGNAPQTRQSQMQAAAMGGGLAQRVAGAMPEQQYPGVFSAPELNEFSWRAVRAGLGGLLEGDPRELQQIIQSNYPEAEFGEVDGQPAVTLPSGQYLLNPEGVDPLDVARFGTDVAAFIPAGRVAGAGVRQLAKGMGTAAATQTGLQGVEAATGGTFDPEDVAIEMATQGVFQAGEAGIRAAAPSIKEFASPLIQNVRKRFAPSVSREAPYEEVAKNITSGSYERAIPEIMADPEVIRAADELGINVNPGVYSTSDIYREMENSLKILPQSQLSVNEKQTVRDLARSADDLITEYTGTTDKSAISEEFTDRMLGTVRQLEDQGDELYEQIRETIPGSLQIRPDSTLDYIGGRISQLDGASNLDSKTREVFNKISTASEDRPGRYRLAGGRTQSTDIGRQPTYAFLDSIRKDIGSALKGKGPFRDASLGELKQLYRTLTDDTMKAAELFGLVDEANLAKETVRKRIALEKQLQGALGKDLSKSLMSELGLGVRRLQGGSPGKFEQIMKAVPESEREIIAISALNNVFAGGSQTSKGFSLGGFVNAYEGLMRNKAAADKLFQYIPKDVKRRMDNIYKVSRGLTELNRRDLANPSGTARAILGGLDAPDGILAKMYNAAKRGGMGAAITSPLDAGMGAAVGIFDALRSVKTKATQRADQMLSSPEFLQSLKMYMTGRTKVSNRIISRSRAAQNWIKEQPIEVKRSIARQGLIQYLVNGESEEDQGEEQ